MQIAYASKHSAGLVDAACALCITDLIQNPEFSFLRAGKPFVLPMAMGGSKLGHDAFQRLVATLPRGIPPPLTSALVSAESPEPVFQSLINLSTVPARGAYYLKTVLDGIFCVILLYVY